MRYQQLIERVINLFTPEQKAQYADEVWDILQKSYEKVGGFKSAADVDELINQTYLWKLVRRDGRITSVNIYSDKHGRKSIASGTNGSTQGKLDYMKTKDEDLKLGRCWAEVSGPVERMLKKAGATPISNQFAGVLTNKDIVELSPDGYHYTRHIAGELHEKVIYGFVKLSQEAQQTLTNLGVNLQELPPEIQLAT